jgi:aryl-alcohol dehydrogenase-like predicted oxidoreductase
MSSPPRISFGTSDLQVTRLCQGTAFRTLDREASDTTADAVLRHCLDVGVRFFDSSNAYGWGGSERLLGQALGARRDEVVICTKVAPSAAPATDGSPGERRLFTAAYLQAELEGSLARLQTDYIDLYLLHSPDGETPMAALCERMQQLVEGGRIRQWGVSNHSPEQVEALLQAAADAGTAPPVGVEDYYTVGGQALTEAGHSRVRWYEREMLPLLSRAGLGLLAFSPMDCGDLAPGRPVEDGSPLATLIQRLDAAAGELNVSRAQVCVAWVLAHPEVTSVLGGPESPAHVDEMVAGTQLALPAEIVTRLHEASVEYSVALEGS